jgi:glutathione S-transferase
MLELYHSINSVCAQKARLALAEKTVPYQERLMTLAGDQFDPAYMKLNPNAVVPTLVHDGRAVVESSVILYYIDEAFPEPPLMPKDLHARAKVRLFNKLVDEYIHNSCMILSFATAFRAGLLRLSPEAREAELAKTPIPRRADYKRDVTAHGLDSHYVAESVKLHGKLLDWIDEAMQSGPYLAGDAYSLADAAVIPYVLRLELLHLTNLWERRRGVAQWWERMRARPSTVDTILNRMTDADWAPFRAIDPEPWPKVRALVAA